MKDAYYIVPIVEKFRSLPPDSEEAKKLALIISVNIGDKDVLKDLGIRDLEPEFVAPEEQPDTRDASSYNIGDNESPDTEEGHDSSSMDTIDSFLDKFGKDIPATGYLAQAQLPPAKQKEAVSELKKLIKDRRYSEAIQLIEGQNLNNPQKSIYFAHQMRFVKKLMAIENYKNKTHG